MALCDACGMDNREKAKFCRGCARALVAPAEAPAAPAPPPGPVQVCATCQTANPLAATVCKSCRTSLVPDWVAPPAPVSTQGSSGGATKAVALIGLVLLVGVGGWWGLRDAGSSVAAPTEASSAVAHQAASLPSLTPTVSVTQATATTATQPSLSERENEQRARDERRRVAAEKKRQQAEREQVAAAERERLAQAQAQQLAERAAQQKAAQEAAARAQLALARAAPAAPPPPAVKTVEQTCASSSNFLAREVCRFQACRDASFAGDPVCVRHREIEAANRRAAAN